VVASTAVEVGVDVPDVGLMIVSDAERLGMTQLHKLRGRLVRNGGQGDFVMMTAKKASKDTLKRLQAVKEHSNGFSLAEADLKLRGFGDVLGDMQSGKSRSTFLLTRLVAEDFLDQEA
jgi:ATP-dependent DNA helicase RecG